MILQRVRIVVGAVSDSVGGRALVVALGVGAALPTVCLIDATGRRCDLPATPAPIADAVGGGSFGAALAANGVALHRVEIPPGIEGEITLVATVAGVSGRATFRPYPTGRGPISFALASCYYGYFREAETYGAWMAEAAATPRLGGRPIAFKILAGDNVYLDVAEDKGRFGPAEAEAEIALRYADYLARDDHLALALSTSPTFTTPDDHDFWNDFPHEVAWLSRTWGAYRDLWRRAAWDAIDTFLAPLNPISPWEGRSYTFVAGGVPFFVADTRSHRTSVHDARPRLMLEEEFDAMIAFLSAAGGPRILVLSQPLWLEAGTLESNLAAYELDFAGLTEALADCPADVLILAGDPHYSRVLELQTRGAPAKTIYEVVSSPAVHIPPSLHIGSGSPGEDDVEVERHVPFACRADARLVVADCLYGTDCNTTFAVLALDPLDGGAIAVSVRFLNHRAGLSVPWAKPTRAGRFETREWPDSTVRFTLRAR